MGTVFQTILFTSTLKPVLIKVISKMPSAPGTSPRSASRTTTCGRTLSLGWPCADSSKVRTIPFMRLPPRATLCRPLPLPAALCPPLPSSAVLCLTSTSPLPDLSLPRLCLHVLTLDYQTCTAIRSNASSNSSLLFPFSFPFLFPFFFPFSSPVFSPFSSAVSSPQKCTVHLRWGSIRS